MRSKLVAVVAALVLAFASACGGDDSGSDGGSGGGGGGVVNAADCPVEALDDVTSPVEITFWHGMTAANETTLRRLVDEYNGSQDKVRVNAVFAGTYGETLDKTLTAMRGGQLPDLVQLEETALRLMIDSKRAVPAAACIEADDYDTSDHLERVIAEFTVEDVLWPVPFNVSNPVLYFNAKAFEKAGLDPSNPPATLDEMKEASQKLVASGATKHGLSLELSAWYVEQWYAKAGEAVVDNDNGRSKRATKSTLSESEVGTEVLAWVHDMVSSKLAMSVGRNPSGADHLLAVANGDAAMTIGTTAALGSIYDVLATGQFPDVELGVGPMPGHEEGGVVVGGASLWMLEGDDERVAASWDFSKWLNEPEQQAAWHAGTGYIPSRKSATDLQAVQDLWKNRPGFKVAYDQLVSSESPPGGAGPVVGGYVEYREAITAALERIVLQNQDPAEALDQMDREATEAIERYEKRLST